MTKCYILYYIILFFKVVPELNKLNFFIEVYIQCKNSIDKNQIIYTMWKSSLIIGYRFTIIS